MRIRTGLFLFSVLLLTACSSLGPSSIARDRFDYISSISDSWKRQMLLNLLKVRYTDAPVFMDVASVINSYEMTGEVNLRGQLADKIYGSVQGDQILSLGATGRYVDRPTISYQPLSGDKFARSLMMPVPVSSILFLIQSGYPADLVMRVCINSVNGLDNAYGGSGNPRAGEPKFHELISAIRRAQRAGGMGMRLKTVKDRQPVVMFLKNSIDESVAEPNNKIKSLLGLDQKAAEFTVVYGDFPDSNTEISILSRSILQVMIDIASYIDVPAKDLAEGRVNDHTLTPEQRQLFPPLIAIKTGTAKPDDAFIAVQYRNQWFWIEDRDVASKQMLTFLMMMFSLTETSSTQSAPILTVPTR